MGDPAFDIVVPTLGRPSLDRMLAALSAGSGPMPESVIVVDDRRGHDDELDAAIPEALEGTVRVVRSGGRGPAAARNVGLAIASAEWTCFLDDDVVPDDEWRRHLARDIGEAPADVAGIQGRIVVPLPSGRRPGDWERNVRGLETARWATADMAYRRAVLLEVGGFDERFRRAYREDADLALRVLGTRHRLTRGSRRVLHPVRPSDPWVSVRLQAGNADDALMRVLHGRSWRRRAGVPIGRFRRHAFVTSAAAASGIALALGRRRLAVASVTAWAAGCAEFAAARIANGPRDAREVATMIATSIVIPPVAVTYRAAGYARSTVDVVRRAARRRPRAVLLDRDGTLVDDVPYNGDPERVRALDGARAAIDRLREAGVPTAVVTNQSGVARGLLTEEDVEEVNRRIEAALGPLGPWLVCAHGPDDACACRKPGPGLITAAAARLGVAASDCVVVGDTAADVAAAKAAGATPILVPNAATRPQEIADAPRVASSLRQAVDLILGGRM
jgi:histidinol-phosphate phosphatase family protein